jgi:hypothetical protein
MAPTLLPHAVLNEVVDMLGTTRKTPPVVAAALLHSILVAANGPSSCKLVKGWVVFTKPRTYALHAWVESGGTALDPAHAVLAKALGQVDLCSTLGLVLTTHEPDAAVYKNQDNKLQRDEFARTLDMYENKAAFFWKQTAPPTVQLKRRMLLRRLLPHDSSSS